MRTIKIRSSCWSDEHRYLLYNCAKRVQGIFSSLRLDIDELVNVGWLACSRRTMDLKGTTTNTVRHMVFFVKTFYLKHRDESINDRDFAVAHEPTDALDDMFYDESINDRDLVITYEPMDFFDDLFQVVARQIEDPDTAKMVYMYFCQRLNTKAIAKKFGISGESVRLRITKVFDSIVLSDDNV